MSKYIERKEVQSIGRMPLEGRIDLTYRCNNNCRHCWLNIPSNSPEKSNELTLDEIKKIVDDARGMGCQKWMMSGGEPMLREDFTEIFDYITRNSKSYSINTNGCFITPEIAALMKRPGVKMIALYGADSEIHDHVTRNPGSFEKAMEGIEFLRQAGVSFTVQVIPMKDNFHQIDQMKSLALSLSPDWRIGASWLYCSAYHDSQRNNEIREQRLPPQQVIELDQPDIFFENWQKNKAKELSEKKSGRGLFDHCVNRDIFHIDPYGYMTFCSFIKDNKFCYNVRDGNFREGWERFIPSLAKAKESQPKNSGECIGCEFQNDCYWCPVYGYLEHKDYAAKVDYLCEIAKEKRKFKENWMQKHRRYFRIAGITIEVNSDLPFTPKTFHPKFKHFEVEGKGDENISLWHHFSPLDLKSQVFGEEVFRNPPWAIFKKEKGFLYISPATLPEDNRYFQVASFGHDYTEGRIYNNEMRKKLFQEGKLESLSLFPSDLFWLAQVVAHKNGCFFHSSGVVHEGKGWLFVGHSGAGKSTIIKTIREHVKILCDDKIAVRKWPDGFKIHGTWSHGEVPDVSSDSAPLTGIFFLEQDKENKVVVTEKGEILKKLLACLMKPFETRDWWEKELFLIEDIIKEVPCYNLHFDKSGEVFKILKGL